VKNNIKLNKNVISEVVNNDLCIGCGVCTAICPTHNLTINFDNNGKYIANEAGRCLDSCNQCFKICPFSSEEYPKNEELMAKEIFKNQENFNFDKSIGFFRNLYVGYAEKYKCRELGSSGGLARLMLIKLLENNIVDYVIHVIPNNDPEKLFKFSVSSNKEDIEQTSKSAYYPVEMSEVLDFIKNNEGNYAITALPCFAKGLRSAQNLNKNFKERIKFIFGLTCGQTKSKFFTNYIAALNGLSGDEKIVSIDFRNKSANQPANNFSFNIQGKKNIKAFWNDNISHIWTNRWFTPNACNYCDDLFAELTDISFMDAWLPEYSQDWKGTNIIISRSEMLSNILEEVNADGEIVISPISLDKVKKSQKGPLVAKRIELSWRLFDNLKYKKKFPAKRVKPAKPKFYQLSYLIMKFKEHIRKKSFEYYPDLYDNKLLQCEMSLYEFIIKQIEVCNTILYKFIKLVKKTKVRYDKI